MDEVRSLAGVKYHLSCFKCSKCDKVLEKGMMVGNDNLGNIFCEEDFALAMDKQKMDEEDEELKEVNHWISPEFSQ